MEGPGAIKVVTGTARTHWRRVAFGLLWLIVVGFAAAMNLERTSLVCRREVGKAAGCTLRRVGLLPRVERFAPGGVGAVEVFEHAGSKGNSRPSYVVTLLDWRGRETGVESYSKMDEAERERDDLRAFFGDRTRLELIREIRPGPAMYALSAAMLLPGLLLILGGVSSSGGLLRIHRAREAIGASPVAKAKEGAAPLAAPPVSRWASGASIWRLFGGVSLIAVVGFGGTYVYVYTTQGWLELEAESRCEVEGATILPGGSLSMALDPGSYTIRVFNPRVPGGWETQQFAIVLHGTTHVYCRSTH